MYVATLMCNREEVIEIHVRCIKRILITWLPLIIWSLFGIYLLADTNFKLHAEKSVEGPVTLLPRPVNSKPTGPVEHQS